MRGIAVLLIACSSTSSQPATTDSGTTDVDTGAEVSTETKDPLCDPIAQTCAPGKKCSYVEADDEQTRACVDVLGSVPADQPCKRPTEILGHDDCAPGSFCTFLGVRPPSAGGTRFCRKLCKSDAQCPMGQRCASVTSDNYGMCGKPCTPFGSDCEADLTCADIWDLTSGGYAAYCRVVGTTAIGAACDDHYACGKDAACVLGTCYALCDSAHPCSETSKTCKMVDGSAGYCVPK
jgi:hypothetical protein